MKLRIRGNSLRLRLLRSEVAELKNEGAVSERICFGPAEGQALEYAIEAHRHIAALSVDYDRNRIVVRVPARMIAEWAGANGREGIRVDLATGEGHEAMLRIAIEKDFACLHDRDGEDDKDAFQNPATDCPPIAEPDIERQ